MVGVPQNFRSQLMWQKLVLTVICGEILGQFTSRRQAPRPCVLTSADMYEHLICLFCLFKMRCRVHSSTAIDLKAVIVTCVTRARNGGDGAVHFEREAGYAEY